MPCTRSWAALLQGERCSRCQLTWRRWRGGAYSRLPRSPLFYTISAVPVLLLASPPPARVLATSRRTLLLIASSSKWAGHHAAREWLCSSDTGVSVARSISYFLLVLCGRGPNIDVITCVPWVNGFEMLIWDLRRRNMTSAIMTILGILVYATAVNLSGNAESLFSWHKAVFYYNFVQHNMYNATSIKDTVSYSLKYKDVREKKGRSTSKGAWK